MSYNTQLDIVARGERIRQLRKKKGLTLFELAGIVGMNSGTLSRLETGKTTRVFLPVLERIAQELDTTVLYLQHGIQDDPPSNLPLTGEFAAANPAHSYLPSVRQSDLLQRLPTLRGEETMCFLLTVESRDMTPRIQIGDQLCIRRCAELVPNKVNVFRSVEDEICLCDVCAYEGGLLLQRRDGSVIEVVPNGSSSRCIGEVVGYCEKMQTQTI